MTFTWCNENPGRTNNKKPNIFKNVFKKYFLSDLVLKLLILLGEKKICVNSVQTDV